MSDINLSISSDTDVSLSVSETPINLSLALVGAQGASGDGMTQDIADSRYIQITDYIDGGTFN